MSNPALNTSHLYCPFPADFVWGAATASYQVEGAAAEDGRAPSVWDTFSKLPGAVAMDHNGDVATDHYHRYKEDVAMMKNLGIKAYRFSIAWPRVIPQGIGQVNPAGLDFYKRLCDELLNAGIAPWPTLFHWDLPQALEDRFGGWESKDCALAFGDYASLIGRELGDRVKGFFTINEFFCYLDKGYGADKGEHFAPGKKDATLKTLCQARHHAVYAHGLAVQALRATSSAPVGLAENTPACVPVRETTEDIAAAREAMREMAGMYLTPVMEGAYHPAYLEDMGANGPVFTEEEMKVIGSPIDFVGLNLYAPTWVRADAKARRGWTVIHADEAYPRMTMPWLTVGPSILYWGPKLVSETWNVPAIYITENGCAHPDRPDASNEVWDTARVMYLQQHLIAGHRGISEGVPLKGYFLWSLMDNFEWAMGYTRRFGLHYVNYSTQERIPKLSAKFYRDVIRRNAVGGPVPAEEAV